MWRRGIQLARQSEHLLAGLTASYESSGDFRQLSLKTGEATTTVCFLASLIDEQKLHTQIIRPLYELGSKGRIEEYLISVGQAVEAEPQLTALITAGNALLFTDERIFALNLMRVVQAQANSASVETVIQGPDLSFSEDMNTNINLLWTRYKRPDCLDDDRRAVSQRGAKHQAQLGTCAG